MGHKYCPSPFIPSSDLAGVILKVSLLSLYHSITAGASKEEIEEKYFKLIRMYKSQLDRNQQNNLLNMDEINEAYSVIKDHFERIELAKIRNTNLSKHPFREKTEHIFEYYKFHIALGIIGVFIFVSISNTSIQA
ncbi:hypothetical protein J2S74_005543 [Evansella vedderi]|uniref:Chaperone protein DnaJ n=1 Tax=Evansella vedderi TaxID=38282 RepID=A0ABU0A3M1_9BACI|nr:J domain-containing protein [Evansella vedderi]MDQ0258079.1 hypothetical protein [Evansella vedderi]